MLCFWVSLKVIGNKLFQKHICWLKLDCGLKLLFIKPLLFHHQTSRILAMLYPSPKKIEI